ncbi:MAG TPA: group III truncated hemoglobin [Parafilimonas sp.]|nr:group III truncated hemoglobin [Parafilimonas sp.]
MKKDIEERGDIELLINSFYDKVKKDAGIGYIFNDVAKVNWEHHLPVMYDFWESIIFNTNSYSGNPMTVHAKLNKETPLLARHFKQWLHLFTTTVDELFEGKKAELAKQRAASIAQVIQIKISNDNPVNQPGIVAGNIIKRKEP